ncbi:hypothetical protein BH23BAC1_BH23BAC1_28880 [soil metagenome]
MSYLTREKLQEELNQLPDAMLQDLYDYIKYLQFKKHQKSSMEMAYASEKVLGKDWDQKEENEAWQDL